MCEPHVVKKTGLTVEKHMRNTVENFLELRSNDRIGKLVIPVIQGYEIEEYLQCIDMYERMGICLEKEKIVGVGSVCRRQKEDRAGIYFEEFPRDVLE